MLSHVPERIVHRVRWLCVIGWFGLILSLFYDPLTAAMTSEPWSPMRDPMLLLDARPVLVQGKAISATPYAVGARIFWGMVIPSSVLVVFVLGHETWRRICPLYFFSQIPRALGLQPRRDVFQNQWLQQNHLYLQFTLFFLGLCARLLFVNSDRLLLGSFFLLTLLASALVVFIYGGRSWCHYFCPFGMVQTVLTGPRGLLDSPAHQSPMGSMTQSMCRTVAQGHEQSACISCKSPCFDIDSEKAYWEQLRHPGRKLVQYGYLGLVIGYFVYYWLYAGNFHYYFSGAWSHEAHQLEHLWQPGFYVFNQAIAIPKVVAVPMTLLAFVFFTCQICTRFESLFKQPHQPYEQTLHRMFTACTFLTVNTFFIYGGRPEILRLPIELQFLFQTLLVIVSTLWLARTWKRSANRYMKESMADKLRRQLKKIDGLQLEGRSLDQLTPDEIYILAKTLPSITQQDRHRLYKGVLRDLLESGNLPGNHSPGGSVSSLTIVQYMRQTLGVTDEQYHALLTELGREHAQLFYPPVPRTYLRTPITDDVPQTLIRQPKRKYRNPK
jgi:hypothetical protein